MNKYEEILNIIEKRTLIGTMSRDYGKTVDDVLTINDANELIMLEEALEQAKKEHDELEALKRVPTAEEVCEAIQENLTLKKIVYNEKDNSFGLEYGIQPLYLPLVESKERFITYFPFLTPKILILIGKFYA